MNFTETDEQQALRGAWPTCASATGTSTHCARHGLTSRSTSCGSEAGRLGFLGVNLPEEYGGGGAGMYELAIARRSWTRPAAAC